MSDNVTLDPEDTQPNDPLDGYEDDSTDVDEENAVTGAAVEKFFLQ